MAAQSVDFFELPVNNDRDSIIENVRINAARGLPELQQLDWSDKPLIVVGGGPSLHDHLEILKAFRPDCHVLAINGAYKFLRSQGITPEHFLLIDSREDNLTHVDSPCAGTNHCLASQVHPRVFEALALGAHIVTLFHLGTEATYEALKGTGEHTFSAAPIGMASIHAIYVAAALGYKTLFLFGYDFSQSPQKAYAYPQPLNANDDTMEIVLDGLTYRTTLPLARTADQFVLAVSPVIRACGLDIKLFSTGLLPAMLRHERDLVPTEQSEREKYEAMWKQQAYRQVSPGMRYVEEAVKALEMPFSQDADYVSVADFGCGLGRCVKWFQDRGYKAVGVDIATNALEEDVPFVESALWDSSKLPKVDYGFSSDVLEHIPPDKVDATLRAIHGACNVGCYLNIDTIPDAFGVLVGERLHLTIQPAEWWEAKLKELWPRVELLYSDAGQAAFVCFK